MHPISDSFPLSHSCVTECVWHKVMIFICQCHLCEHANDFVNRQCCCMYTEMMIMGNCGCRCHARFSINTVPCTNWKSDNSYNAYCGLNLNTVSNRLAVDALELWIRELYCIHSLYSVLLLAKHKWICSYFHGICCHSGSFFFIYACDNWEIWLWTLIESTYSDTLAHLCGGVYALLCNILQMHAVRYCFSNFDS